MKPAFYVIAGPNGVGKSTAAYQLIPSGVEQINPDDIARQLRDQRPYLHKHFSAELPSKNTNSSIESADSVDQVRDMYRRLREK
ncbi:hypothetical protein GCM10023189_31710 [Nibrella saemangeumensis]|uniref:UDP-N-acetylglucosamine kinase n=1 Tax=Nibrella saemangeumensis TaxID=1084526 RepID=A0ABP8MZU3_9BACT